MKSEIDLTENQLFSSEHQPLSSIHVNTRKKIYRNSVPWERAGKDEPARLKDGTEKLWVGGNNFYSDFTVTTDGSSFTSTFGDFQSTRYRSSSSIFEDIFR